MEDNTGFCIRRRNILAVLFSIIATVCLSKFWLVYDSVLPVEIELKGSGKYKAEILLNRQNNNKFKKVKKAVKSIDLSKASKFEFNIADIKYPKRIKIRLSSEDIPELLTLNKISLRKDKYIYDDFKNFTVNGAGSYVKENSLIIKPTGKVIEIISTKPLHAHTGIKLKPEELIIILVLTYLLMYKFSDYLADFSTVKKESRIEIVFLTIFFIMLFIPMLHINNSVKSDTENRNLAKWEPLINKRGELNYKFGKAYEAWFNDRFNFRKELVELNSYLHIVLNKRNEKGYIDKNGFLYMNWEFKHYPVNEIEKSFKNLEKFQHFCEQNNIKLYVMLTPQKSMIYKPDKTYYNPHTIENRHNDFIKYVDTINKSGKMKIIYPYEEMIEASKNNYMFFRTDHHWTDDGAFVGYKKLMGEISKDFPNVKILDENDFEYFNNKLVRGDFPRTFAIGTTGGRIMLPASVNKKMNDKTEYRYYKHKNFEKLNMVKNIEKIKQYKKFKYPSDNKLKVYITGTSMNENLSEFIPFSFSDVNYYRLNTGKLDRKEQFKILKYYKKDILDFSPDILILVLVYFEIDGLKQIMDME